MGGEAEAAALFAHYDVTDVARVSDPERALYRAFGLARGSVAQVLGPKAIWRGLTNVLFGDFGLGRVVGDGFQMPGVFLVYRGRIVRRFLHVSIADRPDYAAMATLPAEESR
jgi:hypothetical protein